MVEHPTPAPPQVSGNGGSRPIPDPTELTDRAIAKLKVDVEDKLDAAKVLTEARIGFLEKEFDRLRKEIDTYPAAIVAGLAHLRALMDEKFKGVADNFAGRDTALAAALLAQKTSVEDQNKANAASSTKSEGATTKLIDGISESISTLATSFDDKVDAVKTLLGAQTKGQDEKINDLRDRITAIDGRSTGGQNVWGYILAGIGAVGVVVSLVIAVTSMNINSKSSAPIVIERSNGIDKVVPP